MADCMSAARGLYAEGPFMMRFLQHHRPRICPFELLIPHVAPGSQILDIGCGAGLFLALLDLDGRVASGLGIDISDPAITQAQTLAGARQGRLTFRRMEADDPLPDGPFDVVSMIDVAHHIPPPAQQGAVEAAFHRLRPGGLFVYKDMGRRPRLKALANRMHDLVMARQWIHYLPIESVDRWMTALGGTRVAAFETDRLWYRHEGRVYQKPGLGEAAAV